MVISVPLFSSVLLALVVAVPADFDVGGRLLGVGLCSVRGDPNEHYDPHGDLYLRPFLQLDSVHQFYSLVFARKASSAMGASTSTKRPLTSKVTNEGENDRVKYASSAMQGLRMSMQDALAVELDLDALKSTSFFGVYDGHGGAEVAMYCAKRFHVMLREEESFLNNLSYAITSVCSRLDDELEAPNVWRASLYPHRSSESSSESSDCFQFLSTGSCANVWRSSEAVSYKLPSYEGSTACVVIIRGNQITVGNVGDSRCVLSKNGQAIDLSTDHKPNVPLERQRILRVGGQVWREKFPAKDSGGEIREQWGPYCIEGKLSTSRALAGIFLTTISGDFAYKNIVYRPQYQMVTHFPDIRVAKITGDTEFLVIASDGICSIQILIVDLNTFFPFRDHMSSQDVVDFVHEKLNSRRQELCQSLINQGKKRECFTEDSQLATNKNIAPNTTTLGEETLHTTCEKLVENCLESRNNATAILVQFKPGADQPIPALPNIQEGSDEVAGGADQPIPVLPNIQQVSDEVAGGTGQPIPVLPDIQEGSDEVAGGAAVAEQHQHNPEGGGEQQLDLDDALDGEALALLFGQP
ncbi:Os02g0607500 [Oryza sativa Japonica Group]|uniref:Putative protein phosphatase 2C 22 n=1 Tax=Oryza sativa subsp. japonica TaxID=39947 RepID=P2C22_ORYSJ|nr:RecName: Full=Putative protein phosphatase 2C 22; Short=OsPP2C22; Flags: Precursor [Oryza sativa Japonica Group]KAB8087869.1 hypothetical protein EE612_012306 [Oryza sativa]BAS79677.1 Os02g0607500 [Oryza sativa Japonica Group]